MKCQHLKKRLTLNSLNAKKAQAQNDIVKIINYISSLSEKKLGINFTPDELKEVIEKVLLQYDGHKKLVTKKTVQVTGIDAYKFGAWSAKYLHEIAVRKNVSKPKRVFVVVITALRVFLSIQRKNKRGQRYIELNLARKILRMYCLDTVHDEHAIGSNGLYLAFKCASEVQSLKK